jgi:hypothetical protein
VYVGGHVLGNYEARKRRGTERETGNIERKEGD